MVVVVLLLAVVVCVSSFKPSLVSLAPALTHTHIQIIGKMKNLQLVFTKTKNLQGRTKASNVT